MTQAKLKNKLCHEPGAERMRTSGNLMIQIFYK